MKRLLLVISLICGFTLSSFAQDLQEVVYLKNGSVIRGSVIEQVPNKSVKIQTADGNIFVYEMSDVMKITKEPNYNLQNTNEYRIKRGYRGFVETGYIIGVDKSNFGRLELITTHGYQFNKILFAGLGAGIGYWTEGKETAVPLYVDVRTDIPTGNKISPYFDVKVGTDVSTEKFCGYVNISVGCRFHINNNLAFNVGVGYLYQDYQAEYYIGESKKKDVVSTDGVSIKAGIEF